MGSGSSPTNALRPRHCGALAFKCKLRCNRQPQRASKLHTDICAARIRSVVAHAKPRDKLPERTVTVICAKCGAKLYKYHKNGKGSLVKCFHKRIAQDFTNKDLHCPECGQEFARARIIRGEPANKIIGGKVEVKK